VCGTTLSSTRRRSQATNCAYLLILSLCLLLTADSYVFGGHTGTAVTSELRILNVTSGTGAYHAQLQQTAASVRASGNVDGIIERIRAMVGTPAREIAR
jgi:hypothetical protein